VASSHSLSRDARTSHDRSLCRTSVATRAGRPKSLRRDSGAHFNPATRTSPDHGRLPGTTGRRPPGASFAGWNRQRPRRPRLDGRSHRSTSSAFSRSRTTHQSAADRAHHRAASRAQESKTERRQAAQSIRAVPRSTAGTDKEVPNAFRTIRIVSLGRRRGQRRPRFPGGLTGSGRGLSLAAVRIRAAGGSTGTRDPGPPGRRSVHRGRRLSPSFSRRSVRTYVSSALVSRTGTLRQMVLLRTPGKTHIQQAEEPAKAPSSPPFKVSRRARASRPGRPARRRKRIPRHTHHVHSRRAGASPAQRRARARFAAASRRGKIRKGQRL